MDTTSGATPEGLSSCFRLRIASVEKLSLANFQNSIPTIHELAVVNETRADGKCLELLIESTPPILKSRKWHLDVVGAGQTYHLTEVDVQLDGAILSRLTEAEKATVRFSLRSTEAPDSVLAIEELVVELLPRNHWGGIGQMPEMVAAFVQPNDPAVDRLLKQASEVLHKHGKSGSIDGYTNGPRRAWELASALWSGVLSMGLDYSLPPASFEHQGQKVRSPSQISESGLATCLDLALLFSAALEEAHLNPLLVFTKEHVFVGVWLKDEEFSTTVVDDITALRKRLTLKELVLFETTLATQRPGPSFSHACSQGSRQIAEDVQDTFEVAVDVRRARMARIRPLAQAEITRVSSAVAKPEPAEPVFEEAPDLPEDDELTDAPNQPLDLRDRLARWQRKLLDLSLRNALLNFRADKKSLLLETPEPGALEDLLAEGRMLKLLPFPELMEGTDPRSEQLHEARERENLRREFSLDALKRNEVFIRISAEEMDARLVELYRRARNSMQEGGSNTLYLALGFLVWSRDDKPGQRIRAPLILLPVTLNRRSARSGFTLSLHEDEPRFNPTLIEMLRQDFRLDLGVADGELPHDDSGLDIAGIWRRVAFAVRDIKGWEVAEDVVLSMFSFAKYLMWKDLTERTQQLRQCPVVKHLIDTPREAYTSNIAFPEPRSLDRDYSPQRTFCPLPTDSSQLSAVMAAIKGKDFVLIGPPGTGKSQTIANLISQCLAEGKRVLFVAEKIAALEVVYRRLREVGLGEFCLELHSNKARKLDVLAQLQKAWDSVGEVDQATWQSDAEKLKKLRDELTSYVERLHLRHPNGSTIFDAIGQVVSGAEQPELHLSWPTANAHGAAAMSTLREVVARLEVNSTAVGIAALTSGPLNCVGIIEWSPRLQQELVKAAAELADTARDISSAYERFAVATGLPNFELDRPARGAICSLAQTLPAAAGYDWQFLFRPDSQALRRRLRKGVDLVRQHRTLTAAMSAPVPTELLASLDDALALLDDYDQVFLQLGKPWPVDVAEELNRGLGLLEEISLLQQSLSVTYNPQIEQIDVTQMQRKWAKSERSFWPMSWLGKRKIKAALEAAIEGVGEPKVAEDLAALVRLRSLREQVAEVNPGDLLAGIWSGLKTRVDCALSAQQANAALTSALIAHPWPDSGLDAAAQGRCGERWTAEIQRLRRLKSLDNEINGLASLSAQSESLWAGRATNRELLRAATAFMRESAAVRDRGVLQRTYPDVAQGKCGKRLHDDHDHLWKRGDVERELAAYETLNVDTTGLWQDLATPTDVVEQALEFSHSVTEATAVLAQRGLDAGSVRLALTNLIGRNNVALLPGGAASKSGAEFVEALARLQPAIDQVTKHGDFAETISREWGDVALLELATRCESLVTGQAGLRSWCAWRKVRQEAVTAGLASVVSAIEARQVTGHAIRPAFEVNYYRWWLGAVIENEAIIRTFVSAEHERRIGEFRALDDKFTLITRAWIRAKLCAELPTPDAVNKNSEWGVLRHEINKKRRHLPLRDLMSRIPSVVLRLTPCLLMSPLSIAQYLSADSNNFDVVVFDEASQIPVWDAIGAMARGKQVVMVGDPKQLPPTSFFDRAESDSDDEDVEGDLDSILDECLGASLPTRNLNWHYRSRHESLIAFSNHRYYGGELVTFPSPVTEDGAVSFHYISGIYEKGGARTNKPEAKALVADLVARLKSPGFKDTGLTIGVVTFNAEQQGLIEDLLDEERRLAPEIEPFFSEVELEPVFVKNLESVQGDERDIMYFSVTYGPDLRGAVSMNFGPLNRDGGERRLNVAVTRARHELRVFSSLKGEQMDLSRTRALGVQDLKHFLEFAERGPRALAEANRGSQGDFESPLEEVVAKALVGKGWEVHTQIGASTFRIDLGVVHPDFSGKYLAGVECDGATYHRSASARDRDKLREQVLRGLGWQILRIWSMDWWVDPHGTLDKVHEQLSLLLETSRKRFAEEPVTSLVTAAPVGVTAKEAIGKPTANAPAVTDESATHAGGSTDFVSGSTPEAMATDGGTSYTCGAESKGSTTQDRRTIFIEADTLGSVPSVNPEAFFDRSYDATLRAMIKRVVTVEGPVLDLVLARRIARAHGFQRTGNRIQERIEHLVAKEFSNTEEEVGTFYWPEGVPVGGEISFRAPGDEVSARGVEEICLQELTALGKWVLAEGKSGDEAVVTMAREVGLSRLRAASRTRLERALRAADLPQSDSGQ